MNFVNTWPAFNHPNLVVAFTALTAGIVTIVIGRRLVRVARHTGQFKPQSLLLILVPVLLVAGGSLIDDYREQAHRAEAIASGAVEAGWAEVAAAIEAKYDIASVQPFGDQFDVVDMVYTAVTNGPRIAAPLVTVQLPESTSTEVFRLRVSSTDAGVVDVALEQQASAVYFDEAPVDPEWLLRP